MEKHELPRELQALLEAARGTGLTDVEVQDRAGLAKGWLSGAERGRYGPRAAGWKLLRGWLARLTRAEPPADGIRAAALQPSRTADSPSFDGLFDGECGDGGADARALALEIAAIGTSPKRHREAVANLTIACVRGTIGEKRGELALRALKAMSASIKAELTEAAHEKLGEAEVMTADEAAEFRSWLESRAPRPIGPGESPAPPK